MLKKKNLFLKLYFQQLDFLNTYLSPSIFGLLFKLGQQRKSTVSLQSPLDSNTHSLQSKEPNVNLPKPVAIQMY